MQCRFIPLLPFVLLPTVAAFAAEPAEVTELPDVVVTAARLPQAERETVGDVTLITPKEIAQHHGQSLPELLATQPGVRLTSTGGDGKSVSLFLRGAGSNATIVLIDGIRYGSATAGTAALQHLPLEQIDRIEILRGPAASLYGADAIGGVVQIFTKQGGTKTRATAEVGAGTENKRIANAHLSGSSGDTRYAVGVAHSRTDGFSAVRNPSNSSYYADKDGYNNTSVTASLSQQISKRHELGVNVLAVKAHNQYDSYTGFPASAQAYDYRDDSRNGAAHLWSRNQWTDSWISRVQAGASQDDSKSYAPVSAADLSDKESRFTTRQTQMSWLNELLIDTGTVTVGAETLQQRVSGTTAYTVNHRRINSLMAGYLGELDKSWKVQLNGRYDKNSQFGESKNGQAGMIYALNQAWKIGGNIGTGFRAPNFNELYYPGFSNPDLKPEKAQNQEVFARYDDKEWTGSVTGYYNEVTNLIQYDAAISKSNNIGKATLRGVTVQGGWQNKKYNAGASFDWLDAKDRSGKANEGKFLARRARTAGTAYAGLKLGRWQARAELASYGYRYDDAANTKRLGGYSLLNLSGGWEFAKDWQVQLKVNNVFDKTYEQVKDYGTAGRNALLSLRWEHQ